MTTDEVFANTFVRELREFNGEPISDWLPYTEANPGIGCSVLDAVWEDGQTSGQASYGRVWEWEYRGTP
jgi:hypothetical protein